MTKPQALQGIRDACRLQHKAYTTEDTYLYWIGQFFDWMKSQHQKNQLPATPAQRMEAYLSTMANGNYAAATQNQAFYAILFFYRVVLKQEPGNVDALRAKRPQRTRFAPPIADVHRLLTAVQDTPLYPYRLILCLLYGCGLRVSEPLGIRLRDIDLAKRRLIIREAKGNKDRLVPIPASLIPPLTQQIDRAQITWQRATAQRVPVKLPHRLGRKYPTAGLALPWFWLFPAPNPCLDPRTRQRVWWHCLPSGVQKALRKAARQTGLGDSITPHHLRHAWATHALDSGASVRDLQEILGHKSLETTMHYAHPQIERVTSPLDALQITI